MQKGTPQSCKMLREILEKLATEYDAPHLRCVPLSIHAAGDLLERYISFHTPTLSALIAAGPRVSKQRRTHIHTSSSTLKLLAAINLGRPPRDAEDSDDRLRVVPIKSSVAERAGEPGQVKV